MPVHVQHNAPGASEGVADHVKPIWILIMELDLTVPKSFGIRIICDINKTSIQY
jgi:hypothetical protein